MFHKINKVSPLTDYKIVVYFQDGVAKIYDVEKLFKKWPRFSILKDSKELWYDARVSAGGFGVIWNDDLDLSCEEIWENEITQ